jgi:hypothetical protein
MQIEGMAGLTPPMIDADPAKLSPMAAWQFAISLAAPTGTTLADCD